MVPLAIETNQGECHSAGGRRLLLKNGKDGGTNAWFLGNQHSSRAEAKGGRQELMRNVRIKCNRLA